VERCSGVWTSVVGESGGNVTAAPEWLVKAVAEGMVVGVATLRAVTRRVSGPLAAVIVLECAYRALLVGVREAVTDEEYPRMLAAFERVRNLPDEHFEPPDEPPPAPVQGWSKTVGKA